MLWRLLLWKNERLESAINSVEGPYGEVVRHLTDKNLPINAKVRIVLLRFIYLQYLRTEAASRKMVEMNAAIQAVPGSDLPSLSIREAVKMAVQSAMLYYAESMAIVDDLKICIARNLTGKPFITSDNPAVLTNRLHIQRRHKWFHNFGVKTAGAIFILPLCPGLCAIVYDSAVYQSSQYAGWIDVTREEDAEILNEHQILNCMSNLYYGDWDRREEIIQHVKARQSRRPTTKHTVIHAALDQTTEWGSRYVVKEISDLKDEEEVLVHIKTNHPEPSAWPSFLRFRSNAKAYSNNTGAGLTRKWCLEQGFVTGQGYQKVHV